MAKRPGIDGYDDPVATALVVDFEFDGRRDGVDCPNCNFGHGNSRLVYSGRDHNVWFAHVDPLTGDFYPSDGQDVMIDRRAAFPIDFGNGSGWMFGGAWSQNVYAAQPPGRRDTDRTTKLGAVPYADPMRAVQRR